MEAIPYTELRTRSDEFREELKLGFASVLDSSQFVGGAAVERFEAQWAEYCGTTDCVAVGNGLDALRLALLAHGISSGDEVLVPAQTFIATWLAVAQTGATPVPVDIDPKTANMDPLLAAAAISPRTAAIVVVHLHGLLADMVAFRQLAKSKGLLLVEDAAQAHGAARDRVKAGAWGDSAAFSFYPTKNLGALGDAGAVTTSDEVIASRVRRLRSYGADPSEKYRHLFAGWNTRMDPIQAVALSIFLPHLDEWNRRRRMAAADYVRMLHSWPIACLHSEKYDQGEHVWHHFVLQVPDRDVTRSRLSESGIGTEAHYPRSAVRNAREFGLTDSRPEDFPVAEAHAARVMSIPMHPWITRQHARRVVGALIRVSVKDSGK